MIIASGEAARQLALLVSSAEFHAVEKLFPQLERAEAFWKRL
jgi:hypothetical protein